MEVPDQHIAIVVGIASYNRENTRRCPSAYILMYTYTYVHMQGRSWLEFRSCGDELESQRLLLVEKYCTSTMFQNSLFTITNTHTFMLPALHACERGFAFCAAHASRDDWRAIYDQTQAIVLSTSTRHVAAEATCPQQCRLDLLLLVRLLLIGHHLFLLKKKFTFLFNL